MVRAKVAGRIDAFAHLGDIPRRTPRPGRGDARTVGQDHADAFDDGIAKVAGKLHAVAENDFPSRFSQLHVSRGGNHIRYLVIGDGIGEKPSRPLDHLDVAGCGDDVALLIEAHFIGAQMNGKIAVDPAGRLPGRWRLFFFFFLDGEVLGSEGGGKGGLGGGRRHRNRLRRSIGVVRTREPKSAQRLPCGRAWQRRRRLGVDNGRRQGLRG